jgi:hypothetical protein
LRYVQQECRLGSRQQFAKSELISTQYRA